MNGTTVMLCAIGAVVALIIGIMMIGYTQSGTFILPNGEKVTCGYSMQTKCGVQLADCDGPVSEYQCVNGVGRVK